MKTRIIHTKFWEDSFVCGLDHKEKLAFLYFLTNSRVGLTGIYELPDRFILFDLQISEDELKTVKTKLQKAEKIYFNNDYIGIKNISKYTNYKKGNPNQIKAFEREIELLSIELKKFFVDNDFLVVIDYLSTSRQLVPQLDINKKSEIINKKTENRNDKELEEAKKNLYEKMKWR